LCNFASLDILFKFLGDIPLSGNRRSWTGDEDAVLRGGLIAGRSLEAIAKQLGRTPEAVKARAYTLGLTLGRLGTRRQGLSRYG
jgi:hypothetical protein